MSCGHVGLKTNYNALLMSLAAALLRDLPSHGRSIFMRTSPALCCLLLGLPACGCTGSVSSEPGGLGGAGGSASGAGGSAAASGGTGGAQASGGKCTAGLPAPTIVDWKSAPELVIFGDPGAAGGLFD